MAITDNLTAFWELEEASGNRIDAVGSNDLTPTNAPGNAAGKVGNGVLTDRASAKSLQCASDPAIVIGPADFAIQAWFKPTVIHNDFAMILAKGPGGAAEEWNLRLNPDNVITFIGTCDPGTTVWSATNFAAVQNTWYHAIVNYTANLRVRIYVNGVVGALASADNLTNFGTGTNNLLVGDRGGLGFTGVIDQVGIWKGRQLSAEEIAWLYNDGNGRSFAEMEAGMGGGAAPRRTFFRSGGRRKVIGRSSS